MADQMNNSQEHEYKLVKSLGDEYKVMNDPIHHLMELHPLCVKIIDTPQFQRLRRIKQIGYGYAIYPAASHNRFEHSIGVCHLAGKLLRALQSRQQDDFANWRITNEDILCVKIAGLCHDLGHGPFSHVFDNKFIPMVQQKKEEDPNTAANTWTHEQGSVKMLQHLKEDNKLTEDFEKYGITNDKIHFIEDLIQITSENWETMHEKYRNKEFLFEIVSNKRNNIDVDKWDYFARDCHMLGIQNNFDCNRCIQFSRVIKDGGMLQICYREKEAYNIFEMFHTRNTLQRRHWQHKTIKILEYMISEALVLADDHTFITVYETEEDDTGITVKGNKKFKLSEAMNDMRAYEQLTDEVIFQIYQSATNDGDMKKCRKIVDNIMKRKIYKLVTSHLFEYSAHSTWVKILTKETASAETKETTQKNDIDIERDIHNYIKEFASATLSNEGKLLLKQDDHIIVQIATFEYGNKENNPTDKVRFYKKSDNNTAFKMFREQITFCLPKVFQEKEVRVYCKLSGENKTEKEILDKLKDAFETWCIEKDCLCEICKENKKKLRTKARM